MNMVAPNNSGKNKENHGQNYLDWLIQFGFAVTVMDDNAKLDNNVSAIMASATSAATITAASASPPFSTKLYENNCFQKGGREQTMTTKRIEPRSSRQSLIQEIPANGKKIICSNNRWSAGFATRASPEAVVMVDDCITRQQQTEEASSTTSTTESTTFQNKRIRPPLRKTDGSTISPSSNHRTESTSTKFALAHKELRKTDGTTSVWSPPCTDPVTDDACCKALLRRMEFQEEDGTATTAATTCPSAPSSPSSHVSIASSDSSADEDDTRWEFLFQIIKSVRENRCNDDEDSRWKALVSRHRDGENDQHKLERRMMLPVRQQTDQALTGYQSPTTNKEDDKLVNKNDSLELLRKILLTNTSRQTSKKNDNKKNNNPDLISIVLDDGDDLGEKNGKERNFGGEDPVNDEQKQNHQSTIPPHNSIYPSIDQRVSPHDCCESLERLHHQICHHHPSQPLRAAAGNRNYGMQHQQCNLNSNDTIPEGNAMAEAASNTAAAAATGIGRKISLKPFHKDKSILCPSFNRPPSRPGRLSYPLGKNADDEVSLGQEKEKAGCGGGDNHRRAAARTNSLQPFVEMIEVSESATDDQSSTINTTGDENPIAPEQQQHQQFGTTTPAAIAPSWSNVVKEYKSQCKALNEEPSATLTPTALVTTTTTLVEDGAKETKIDEQPSPSHPQPQEQVLPACTVNKSSSSQPIVFVIPSNQQQQTPATTTTAVENFYSNLDYWRRRCETMGQQHQQQQYEKVEQKRQENLVDSYSMRKFSSEKGEEGVYILIRHESFSPSVFSEITTRAQSYDGVIIDDDGDGGYSSYEEITYHDDDDSASSIQEYSCESTSYVETSSIII